MFSRRYGQPACTNELNVLDKPKRNARSLSQQLRGGTRGRGKAIQNASPGGEK
jgi:hypothetical protein